MLRTIWLIASLLATVLCTGVPADARPPLLQEGKKTLYQRVVTHPGAKLFAGSEQGAAVVTDQLKTFTSLYVYGRQNGRIEVGAASDKADGWIDEKSATVWPQAITMLLTDRMGRDPVLFFKEHAGLEQTCQAQNIKEVTQRYLQQLSGNQALPADFPVLATEPVDSAVSEKNFYLLPVLNIDRKYSGLGLSLIEVASINPGTPEEKAQNQAPLPAAADFRTGFAFVIDTTISMKPYIDQTLALIRSLYDELEKSPHGDKMAFAVVAFRSNMERSPGIEYTAKVICDFKTVKQRAELEKALSGVTEATVSTHDINEDSFAGVKEAADSLSWKDYGSRVMLLVTDAGPLGAGDPTSHTGLSPEALADYLKTNRIYLSALHVKAPSGAKNHAYAEAAYKELSRQADNQVSYIPLNAETPAKGAAAFDSVGHQLATSYARMVTATAEGKFLPAPQAPQKKNLTPEEIADRIAASTGYAMQLQFLGTLKQRTAPEVVKAWIADADLGKLEQGGGAPVYAARPAVLLTKGQLSRLRQQLKVILKGAEDAFLNGNTNLFEQIRSAAAALSSDPNAFSLQPGQNLAESGMLEEILSDLPYKSRITGMTDKTWADMSTGQRDKFMRDLKGLIARYDEYDRDATHWESFGSKNPDDWVYRVPLNMLP